ncbi:MAG: tRNA uridine-5-carboxymethylaminomethyl(34) synthesis enzyme MnmG, partial [Clostridia bacterium]
NLGIEMRRFKTGTPARIYRNSIDFDEMEEQRGENCDRFSFLSPHATFVEEPCYLTYTNLQTHQIIKDNIGRSPLYNGSIHGIGPRYCPSIEDKVMRFKDKERHQIFVEPEGQNSDEMYIQGMSSSLPHDVQEAMYHTLPGLRHCKFAKYAYAIEYDCIDPLQLLPSLEMKAVQRLFTAGQINGSSGYEEAAGQGLIAGINAVQRLENKPPLVLRRDEAYIGVLIDDLVTKGTNEPYRMMTARAEHRIKLRQDNADMRLTEKSYALGLATEERLAVMKKKREEMQKILSFSTSAVPREQVAELFAKIGEPVPQRTTFGDLARRPEFLPADLRGFAPIDCSDDAFYAAVVELKYEGYLKKQESAVTEQKRLEDKALPPDINYFEIKALRIEARQKLDKIRPFNLGQASRISGVSPADIAVLIIFLSRNQK